MKTRVTNERGVATLVALLMIGMLLLIGLAALSTTDDEITIAGNEKQEMRAFYAAEAGLEQAAAALEVEYDSTGQPPLSMPGDTYEVNGCQGVYKTVDNGPAEIKVLTAGTMAGLYALVKSFTILGSATSQVGDATVVLSQSFETALVPIFQFAVFYENDLWATPANDMSITGRVHVNGNMFLQASTNLYFDSRVSASGEIHHGFPGNLYSGANGGVYFKDIGGNYQNMYQDGSWLDNDDPDWYNESSQRWDGLVTDEAFGQEELKLPLTNADSDPHKIIERADGNPDSYETKASLKIIDGVPYSFNGGTWVDISAVLAAGTIQQTTFYDDRENRTCTSTDIDMDKLNKSGYFPPNGVIYSSDHRSGYPVLRLRNAAEIAAPLSVFSENPAYLQGDFNTVDKQPVAVAADAVTYLSNDWIDANSTSSMTYRTTSPTTYNVSMITGDLDTDVQQYSGGLANLPRFLEKWDKDRVTINGSMVNLWRTRQAVGMWHYGDSEAYYTAPTRDYRFDKDLEDPNYLPPETPTVRTFIRTGWQQQYVNFEVNDETLD